MSAYVTGLMVDSSNGYATAKIVVARRWSPHVAQASDLPEDIRDELLRWLGVRTLHCPDCGSDWQGSK